MAQLCLIGADVSLDGLPAADLDGLFKLAAESGLKVIRLHAAWPLLEPQRDQWDFAIVDAAFEAAKKHGLRIAAGLTPADPPSHRAVGSLGEVASTREALLEADQYIKRIVTRYRNHEALLAWMLLTPSGNIDPEPMAIEQFRAELKRRYDTIEALNAAWGSAFAGFDAVQPATGHPGRWMSRRPMTEWLRFRRHHLAWYVKYLADTVARHDQKKPVCADPMLDAVGAVDWPLMAGSVDLLGGNLGGAAGITVADAAGLLRYSAGTKPFWITGLPVNPAATGPVPLAIQRSLWQAVFAGAAAALFDALRTPAASGPALCNALDAASPRLAAIAGVAGVLQSQAALFASAAPPQRAVAVVFDLDSLSDGLHVAAAQRHLMALARLGVAADIVVAGGESPLRLNGYQLILAPSLSGMSPATAQALQGAVENVAHLWVSGPCAVGGARPDQLAGILGAAMSDVRRNTRGELQIGQRIYRFAGTIGTLAPAGAEVTGTCDGVPAATSHSPGKGRATWIAADFADCEGFAATCALAELLRPHVPSTAELALAPDGVTCQRLQSAGAQLLLWTSTASVPRDLSLPGQARVLAASEGAPAGQIGAFGWVVASVTA